MDKRQLFLGQAPVIVVIEDSLFPPCYHNSDYSRGYAPWEERVVLQGKNREGSGCSHHNDQSPGQENRPPGAPALSVMRHRQCSLLSSGSAAHLLAMHLLCARLCRPRGALGCYA